MRKEEEKKGMARDREQRKESLTGTKRERVWGGGERDRLFKREDRGKGIARD